MAPGPDSRRQGLSILTVRCDCESRIGLAFEALQTSKSRLALAHGDRGPGPFSKSEIVLDQGPRRQQFRSNRGNGGPRQQGQRPVHQRPPGIRPPSDGRHTAQNARNNYERYTTMAKDATRRGDVVEAENLYQHAEHYFRVMKEQQ